MRLRAISKDDDEDRETKSVKMLQEKVDASFQIITQKESAMNISIELPDKIEE